MTLTSTSAPSHNVRPIGVSRTAIIAALGLAQALPAFASAPDTRIAELKKEILAVGDEARSRAVSDSDDNDPAVRAKLDPLVAELVSLAPKRPEFEKLVDSLGAWKSVWSDLPGTNAFADAVYQVVFPGGYYYNISKEPGDNGQERTGYLRGTYVLREKDLGINFTKAVLAPGFPAKGTDLATLAMKAEIGLYDEAPDPEGQKGLGRPGNLITEYVDGDFRVVRGSAEQNQVFNSLFILRRVTAVE